MAFFLVTGGAGFIGSHLVERLTSQGARVRVLDNLSTGKLETLRPWGKNVEFYEGDVRDASLVKRMVEGVDYVFHEAARLSVPESVVKPLEYHDVNVTGTLNVFMAAKEAGVKKIVFASSSAVYGDAVRYPQREGEEKEPISPYALSKKLGEEYVRLFATVYGVPAVSLRYFNVFGPRQSLDDEYSVVIPKFINCLLRKESPPIYGDGTQSRDFVSVASVVDANLAAAFSDLKLGEVINVGCGEARSVLDLARILAELMNVPHIRPTFLPPRPGDVQKTHADIGRLKNLLRVSPNTSFREDLQETIRWFQQQC